MRLKGRVAVITGAGSGIGRASAIVFAKEGAKVVVVDIVSEAGKETVKLIKENGGEAVFVEADVSKAVDAKRMIETAVDKYEKLDILFNNAGIGMSRSLIDVAEDEWDRQLDVNLKGIFLGSKYAIPVMIKCGGGVIINTASELGLIGAPKTQPFSAYSASKGGIISLTKSMALEYAPHIRVNCICPGTVQTPLYESSLGPSPELTRKAILRGIPLGRIASPKEIAYAALFLASEEASYITGIALCVDGGSTAQ